MVDGLDDLAGALSGADPSDKALIYSELGVAVTYDHDQRLVVAEVRPDAWATVRVGGPTQQICCQALAIGYSRVMTPRSTAVRISDGLGHSKSRATSLQLSQIWDRIANRS